jgi:heme/copper-type cytochrome/quinol oxidase subunit 2
MRPLYVPAILGLSLVLAAFAFGGEPASMGPPFTVPVDSDGVQRTTVILDSYSYEPAHLIVEKDKPVELTLKSVTLLIPHNFIIKDRAAGLAVEQDVSAGKTATVKFTPMQSGTFPIYCDKRLWPLPSHRDKGMEGKLEVR